MSHHTGVVIEAQPDWLTVSAHGEDRARDMLDLALGLAKEEEARGHKPSRWRSMGYEGIHVGRIEYGQRDARSTEIRLSGDAASANLDVCLSLADAVTRFDLAVTWRSDPPNPRIGIVAYAKAKRFYAKHPRSALPWTTNNAKGGWTLYIGKRESENFFRLYDKEQEEREDLGADYDGRYNACWRYELETKASVAWALAHKVQRLEDRATFTQGYLHAYTLAHGLEPPFDAAGGQALQPGFRRRSDEESKLAHMRRNVRPSVQYLIERGRQADAEQALGIPRPKTILRLGPFQLARWDGKIPTERPR